MHPARRGIGHKNVYICQCIRSVASDTAKQWCFKKLQVEAMLNLNNILYYLFGTNADG